MENILHFLFGKYFGIDWAGLVLLFISTHLLGNKNRYGFIAGICSNICWILYGILAASVADPLANFIILFLNVHGFLLWGKKTKESFPRPDWFTLTPTYVDMQAVFSGLQSKNKSTNI